MGQSPERNFFVKKKIKKNEKNIFFRKTNMFYCLIRNKNVYVRRCNVTFSFLRIRSCSLPSRNPNKVGLDDEMTFWSLSVKLSTLWMVFTRFKFSSLNKCSVFSSAPSEARPFQFRSPLPILGRDMKPRPELLNLSNVRLLGGGSINVEIP